MTSDSFTTIITIDVVRMSMAEPVIGNLESESFITVGTGIIIV